MLRKLGNCLRRVYNKMDLLEGLADTIETLKELSDTKTDVNFFSLLHTIRQSIWGKNIYIAQMKQDTGFIAIRRRRRTVFGKVYYEELFRIVLVKSDSNDNYYIESAFFNADDVCFYNDYDEELDAAEALI
mgnify:CR=1 FL=1